MISTWVLVLHICSSVNPSACSVTVLPQHYVNEKTCIDDGLDAAAKIFKTGWPTSSYCLRQRPDAP